MPVRNVLFVLAVPAAAQVQRGVIHGTVHDASGAVLPGALVQLTSEVSAPREAAPGGRGDYRFQDLDPGRYTLRTTLDGFAPLVRPDVIVNVGASVEIPIEMAVGAVTEEVIVSRGQPGARLERQGNVTNFDQVMLNEVPTARDPWALMQHLPGVSIGRPNVGGSESTNQAQFAARGDNGANTMWNLDGVTITDMAAVGASTTYFDFNVFEEVQFTTGGMDPRQQTGGLGINMVSKRGTSALRAAGAAYFTNDDLQGENISAPRRRPGSGNRISSSPNTAAMPADRCGPIGSGSGPAARATTCGSSRSTAIPDGGVINTVAARGDAQAGTATRFSFLYHRAEKPKTGRFAGADRPPETTLDQDGATHISKAEVSHVFAPALFLSGKFAYVDLAFGLTPQGGLDAQAWRDFAAQVWHGSHFLEERPGPVSNAGRRQLVARPSRREVRLPAPAHVVGRDGGWPGDGTDTSINAEARVSRRASGLRISRAVGRLDGDGR